MTIKSEIREIPANLLSVDPRVQRQLDPRRVVKLAGEWDDLMVGVLTVSHRDSGRSFPALGADAETVHEYVVLDGQTWLAAFRQVCGQDTVLSMAAEVYEGLTVAEEAAMFIHHNDRKVVLVRDKFRLAVTAGEPWAVEINEILLSFGWAARGIDAGRPMHQFDSVSAAERIHRAGGPEALRKTFQTITNAWGSKQRAAVNAQTLHGIGLLHARHPELDSKQISALVHKLSKVPPGTMAGEITADRRRYNQSTTVASYNWILALYNRGRGEAHRLSS